jgi:hypothetical protein
MAPTSLSEVVLGTPSELAAPEPLAAQSPTDILESDSLSLCFAGLASQDPLGLAYGEDAFHYFLEIERRRSEALNRPFLLMLIDFKGHSGMGAVTSSTDAPRLFSALGKALRETDFWGWYREARVAGAVLTQDSQRDGADVAETARRRVARELLQHLPDELSRNLQVRVYQLSPSAKLRAE